MLRAGELQAALEIYEDELAFFRRLVAADASDVHARRGVTICYERLGDVALRQDRIEAAKAYYQDGLEMRRRLVDARPGDVRARRELTVFCERLLPRHVNCTTALPETDPKHM
ncbi:MAG TPA: tetratricopeptide repeat protein [Pirellulales bacterium]|nr:tetratricopeptide repeat protein [Pirellulales bacterium]